MTDFSLSAPTGRLLVYEQSLRWTTALRRLDPTLEPMRLRSLRSLAHRVAQFPASLLFWELRLAELRNLLSVIDDLKSRAPRLLPFAFCPELPRMTPADVEELRFALLEFGVPELLGTPRDLDSLLPIIRRRLAETLPELSLQESVQQRLPWKPGSTGQVSGN